MSEQSGKLKRNLKRSIGLLLLLSVLCGILAVWGWRTVRTNHAYTIKRVQELARERFNAKLELGGYELDWVAPFPSLGVTLKDIRLATALDSMRPILRANDLRTRINLKDWWTGDFRAAPVVLDSAWVHLRKDAEGRSNLRFAATSERKIIKPWTFDLIKVPEITFHFLDVHNENLEREKWQRAQLLDGRFATMGKENDQDMLKLSSKVHFDGLMFNPTDGGYLMDRRGVWDLNFGLADDGLVLQLHPSTLRVDSTNFLLDGTFYRADTNRLQLRIQHEGVLMSTVLPMLSNKMQRKLGDIKVDQPVAASFVLDELLHPSKNSIIKVDFSATDAAVQYSNLSADRTDFSGYYSNDCDGNGVGDSENSCVVIERAKGDLFGVLPTDAKGRIDDLSDPQLKAAGTMDILLPRLNDRLSASNKITFKKGAARLEMTYQGPFNDIIRDPFNEEKVKMEGDVSFRDVILNLPSKKAPFPSLDGRMHFNDQATQLQQLNLEWMGSTVLLSGGLKNLPEFLFFDDQALQCNLRLHFDHLKLDAFNTDGTVAKAVNIDQGKIREIARKIATNINGQLQLDIDRLTYDTFELTDVHTQVSLYSPLLYAENADSAMIQMDKLSANFMGQTPFEIGLGFSQEADTKLLLDLDFPDAQVFANSFLPAGNYVKSGRVSLNLKGRIPLVNINQPEQLFRAMTYSGHFSFDEVDAEMASFTWPIKTLSGALRFDQDRLEFDAMHFYYEGAPFDLNGTVEHYRSFGEAPAEVDLQLRGQSLNWPNNQIRQSNGPKSLFSPAGLLQGLDTLFHLATGRLALKLDTVYTLEHTITPLEASITLEADPNNEKHYQLQLEDLRVGLGGRNLILGSAKITNPDNPQFDAQVTGELTFRKLADFLPSDYIDLQDGFFRIDLDYRVPLYNTLDAKHYLLGATIDGKAEVVDGKLFYNYRGFQVDDFYSHISFNNRDLNIRDLDLRLNGNRLFADGTSTDFFPFFILPDKKARIELNVASPDFDFGGFTAPQGLGKENVAIDTATSVFEKTRGFIDQLLSNGSLDMNANFDLLQYEDFQAKKVKGNISLHPDTVRLDSVRMNLAKGDFLIDGSITNIIYHRPKIEVDAQFLDSNIRQLFQQFQNFGQSDLDSSNLKGHASIDVQFRSEANANYSLLPNTMYGDLQFKLFGGQLISLPAVRKISGFLSKKRRLDHILIDTLETTSYIRGSDLYIEQFKLHSSSFDFNIEGIYSLGEKDNTRILFGVPLSNLFRRHVSAAELDEGNRERKGLNIFIEARPRKDKLRFRWKIPFSRKPYRLPEIEKD